MPRVKFDYVVSFTSEDPEHRAANLLAGEVSKKKWLCSKGEPSSSVLLQLPRAIEISAVQIGAHHAALVEVLVGLSEKPNDPFQVLVPSCVFVSPAQSRREEGVARVRSFSGEELTADTRGKRYDRVRVVCSQPYNKHCQYGLSFIHIHEPESRNDPSPPAPTAPAVPSRIFALDTFSSDEEEFRPGELFAKHLNSPNNSDNPASASTGAQIRQATSQALKNISDSSTKITKTPISKPGTSRQKQTDEVPTNRQRDSIMYTDEDAKPHDKIDRVVNKHKDEQSKHDELNETKLTDKDEKDGAGDNSKNKRKYEHSKKDNGNKHSKTNKDGPVGNTNRKKEKEAFVDKQKNSPRERSAKKRKRDDDDWGREAGEVCEDLSQILRGVTLALSGYMGDRRAAIRDNALALGARYSPDWTPQCTHLICAFPNTPKLRTARASGAHIAIVTAEWLQDCLKHRRRLPWRWFATEKAERVPITPLPEEPKPEPAQSRPLSDGDTDDEIQDVLRLNNSKIGAIRNSTSSPARGASLDSDVSFVRDERFVGHVSLDSDDDDDDTDVKDEDSDEERIDPKKALPDFFDGYTFVITDEVVRKVDRDMLAKYVRAFGGLLLEESEIDEDTHVDYMICSEKCTPGKSEGKALRVQPGWVWHCGRERRLCTPNEYVPV